MDLEKKQKQASALTRSWAWGSLSRAGIGQEFPGCFLTTRRPPWRRDRGTQGGGRDFSAWIFFAFHLLVDEQVAQHQQLSITSHRPKDAHLLLSLPHGGDILVVMETSGNALSRCTSVDDPVLPRLDKNSPRPLPRHVISNSRSIVAPPAATQRYW